MKAKTRRGTHLLEKKRLRRPEPRAALYEDLSCHLDEVSNIGRPGVSQKALGTQLLIELRDCLTDQLDNLEWVRGVMVEAARRAGATIIDIVFHKFNPAGISGVIVIAESHIAIHTWPEYRYAAVDIFSCGKRLKGSEAASFIIGQFRCSSPSVVEVERGLFPPRVVHRVSPLRPAS